MPLLSFCGWLSPRKIHGKESDKEDRDAEEFKRNGMEQNSISRLFFKYPRSFQSLADVGYIESYERSGNWNKLNNGTGGVVNREGQALFCDFIFFGE